MAALFYLPMRNIAAQADVCPDSVKTHCALTMKSLTLKM
ncbi:hypothetical protein [Citrobacter pasteurii]|nr:hypothetical protein SF123566_9870 [Shigella flexneri 1235-66]CEJ67242.1 hypothetical protein [Citrobacter pasteurii]